MKRWIAALVLSLPLVGCALEATLTWDAVTLDADGAALTVPVRYVVRVDGADTLTTTGTTARVTMTGNSRATVRTEARAEFVDADGPRYEWIPGAESEAVTVRFEVPGKTNKLKVSK
jgi:hypothetical protein